MPSAGAQDNYEIRRIRFTGNKTFGRSELLDRMAFRESNFLTRKLQKKDPSLYSGELMEVDLDRLERYYQSEGFLHVRVRLDSIEADHRRQRVDLLIGVNEGEPVRVDSVYIAPADTVEHMPRRERLDRQLYGRLDLQPGDRFTDDALQGDRRRLGEVFARHGYVYATVDYRLELRPDTARVGIDYTIRPGVRGRFGETTVAGNRYVREKHIRRQLDYRPGEVYDPKRIDDTRRRLYELQLFRIVSITPQLDRTRPGEAIPLHFRMEEMPRWTGKFGVGWGTEDKFRAFADVTYRGLFGGTSRLNLYARHSALEPYHVSLSWIEPQFIARGLSLTVNPYIRREREPAYDVQRLGLNLPVGYAFNDRLKCTLAYYLERVKQFDALAAEKPSGGYLDPMSREFLYNKSGLSASLSYSSAQPAISPVRGGSVSVGGRVNGYLFGGDFNYTKLWVDARKYLQLRRLVVAGRLMVGGIHSSDSHGFVPMEERFYSGGSNSNRGWRRSTLGPSMQVTEEGETRVMPAGGKSIIEANIELRHPLVWQIELAAFVDVGNVWAESYRYALRSLSYTAGGGLRVNTPIGPIRLDVGYPFAGPGDRHVQVFLSVGQAF